MSDFDKISYMLGEMKAEQRRNHSEGQLRFERLNSQISEIKKDLDIIHEKVSKHENKFQYFKRTSKRAIWYLCLLFSAITGIGYGVIADKLKQIMGWNF